jgi:extradiol dioxygenase family protein
MIYLDHIVLHATDVEKTINFYHQLLNVPVENWQRFVDGEVKFPSLRISDTFIIDFFPPSMWKNNPLTPQGINLNHYCMAFEPDQWQTMVDYIAEQNIEILQGPETFWGARGNGTSVFIKDPDGNKVELRKYG